MPAPTLTFVTQVIDPQDPVLAFTLRWIEALADRCEFVTVVANEVREVPASIPGNVRVRSLGKEVGAGRIARGLRYERILASGFARGSAPDALLAHMCPQYLTLAAPLAKLRNVPTMLWFTHGSDSATLRLADRLAHRILTTVPGSYPRPGPKVRAIGHGIDVDALPLAEPRDRSSGPLRLVMLGRTSDSKRYDVALRGIVSARSHGVDVRLVIHGPSGTDRERAIRDDLRRMIKELGVGDVVELTPGIPPSAVAEELHRSDAVISTTIDGSADKVVFEAMAAGRPVVTSNSALLPTLTGSAIDLGFAPGDGSALGAAIARLAAADRLTLEQVGVLLRRRVEAGHSIAHWADATVDAVLDLRSHGHAAQGRRVLQP